MGYVKILDRGSSYPTRLPGKYINVCLNDATLNENEATRRNENKETRYTQVFHVSFMVPKVVEGSTITRKTIKPGSVPKLFDEVWI